MKALMAMMTTIALGSLAFAQERPNGPVANDLVYRTPRGASFTVTAEGLSSITYGGRELARGGWSAFSGEGWFMKNPGAVKVDKLQEKRLEKLDDRHARVVHVKGDVTCTADYSFAGEDVMISARIENRHPDAALEVTGFGGLEFTFGKQPEGLMCEQHITYFQFHGVGLCHPSHFSRIGGSYAQDGTVGVGVSPWRTGLTHTLILWDYTDWNQGKREKLPSRRLLYFVADPVPARGARTFDLRLRVSPDVAWQHLLEPYRTHFQATFGPHPYPSARGAGADPTPSPSGRGAGGEGVVRYKADYRWIATDYLNHSQQAVSPENPYGFHGDFRRIDTLQGAAKFCAKVVPGLRAGQGQGIIVWGQAGDDPRGGMYRPDFDVLPPEVEKQWPTIAKSLKDANQKLGVCTRPRDLAVKLDWRQDQIIPINADDPVHRAMLWQRFERMQKRGCTLFYLDSFGDSLEDVKLMRFLRDKLGPDTLTFCEHQCDAIMPFSGGYSETTLHADVTPQYYRLWSGMREWEIYQWLVPGSQMASRLFETKGKPAADGESVYHWFFSHHVTPLVPVNDLPKTGDMPALQTRFLTGTNGWKD